jgi:hypothetical protein
MRNLAVEFIRSQGGKHEEMLATYRLHQRETSLEVRQVFMARPDDE